MSLFLLYAFAAFSFLLLEAGKRFYARLRQRSTLSFDLTLWTGMKPVPVAAKTAALRKKSITPNK